MNQRQTLTAILAVGIFLTGPMAWGCEGTGMQNCSMSDCSTTTQREVDACHDSDGSSETGSSGCEAAPESWIACCDGPVDPEPAEANSWSSWDDSTSPLVHQDEKTSVQPPSRPPDFISVAVSTRLHSLGRFALLSSYLL